MGFDNTNLSKVLMGGGGGGNLLNTAYVVWT